MPAATTTAEPMKLPRERMSRCCWKVRRVEGQELPGRGQGLEGGLNLGAFKTYIGAWDFASLGPGGSAPGAWGPADCGLSAKVLDCCRDQFLDLKLPCAWRVWDSALVLTICDLAAFMLTETVRKRFREEKTVFGEGSVEEKRSFSYHLR